MKVRIFSDIHLEHFIPGQKFPIGSGDVLILAGDILNAKHFKTNGYLRELYLKFLDDASTNYKDIIYIFGNHEYYGYNYEGALNKIQMNVPTNFHILNNKLITINNWNFIGFTLWTDFRNENPLEMMEAHSYMNDYKSIRIGKNYRKLNPDDTLAMHRHSKNYLLEQLNNYTDNVFVISHHAPSYQSIPQEFKTSTVNSAYASNLDDLIYSYPQIKYWAHGHTHTKFDYMIGETRIICNPSGYPVQNTRFDPDFEIILP